MKKYKNKVKILNETNFNGQVILEVSYLYKKGVYIKNLKIFKENLIHILKKFKKNNFIIEKSYVEKSNLIQESKSDKFNWRHPEYIQNNLNNFVRKGFQDSYTQKFN
jgi:hypothetical protein